MIRLRCPHCHGWPFYSPVFNRVICLCGCSFKELDEAIALLEAE